MGTLAADSSNVVDLVEDLYNVSQHKCMCSMYRSTVYERLQRITQRIVFVPEIVPGLSVKVTPVDCPGK